MTALCSVPFVSKEIMKSKLVIGPDVNVRVSFFGFTRRIFSFTEFSLNVLSEKVCRNTLNRFVEHFEILRVELSG